MKKYVILFAACLLFHLFELKAQQVWTQKLDHLGSPRFDFAGFSLNGKGYIGGGSYAGVFNSISEWQEFNPLTNTWSIITAMPYPFTRLTAFEIGGFGFVANGVNDAFYNYDTFRYNQAGSNWATLSSLSYPRLYASSAANGVKGYIIGGYDFMASPMNDAWEYNPVPDLWTQIDTLPAGAARYNSTAFAVSGNIFVFGGTNDVSYLNDLWKYDTISHHWLQKTSMPAAGRQLCTSFVLNDEAYLVGGNSFSGPNLYEVWKYNAAADSWVQLANFPGIHAPFGGTAFTINGKGYIVSGNGTSECWEFDAGTTVVTGINDKSGEIKINPNPVTDRSVVLLPHDPSTILSVEFYNCFGQKIKSVKTTGTNLMIEKNDYVQGVYYLRVLGTNSQARMLKFIVQ
ncbi:MAG: T9SS type A sorting domain-containing protein [Bacteroidetes bacterium]|nr:T9SS type A sorting domain-containing protein [Bacteroidota bacterium]